MAARITSSVFTLSITSLIVTPLSLTSFLFANFSHFPNHQPTVTLLSRTTRPLSHTALTPSAPILAASSRGRPPTTSSCALATDLSTPPPAPSSAAPPLFPSPLPTATPPRMARSCSAPGPRSTSVPTERAGGTKRIDSLCYPYLSFKKFFTGSSDVMFYTKSALFSYRLLWCGAANRKAPTTKRRMCIGNSLT